MVIPTYVSPTETILQEFMGIPGLNLSLITPNSFLLEDKKASDSNYFKKIKITTTGKRVLFENSHPQNLIDSPLYEVNEGFFNSDTYQKNDLLSALLKQMLRIYATVEDCDIVKKANYAPSLAYVNVGIVLGIILCSSKEILSHNVFIDGSRHVPIDTTLPAEDILDKASKTKTLQIDNESLKEEISRLKSKIRDLEDMVLKYDLENGPKTPLAPEDEGVEIPKEEMNEIVSTCKVGLSAKYNIIPNFRDAVKLYNEVMPDEDTKCN